MIDNLESTLLYGRTTIWLLKIVCSILIFVIVRWNDEAIPTTKQSPWTTKLLIGSNQGIASSRHWDFDNSNIVLAGFAMTVNQRIIAGRCDDAIPNTKSSL